MAEKSVFVPTGEVRCPRAGEWYWCDECHQMENAPSDYAVTTFEIYEEIKVRVDEGSE